jgi:hypothetical protein
MRDFFIGLFIIILCIPIAVLFKILQLMGDGIESCKKLGREERLFKE